MWEKAGRRRKDSKMKRQKEKRKTRNIYVGGNCEKKVEDKDRQVQR